MLFKKLLSIGLTAVLSVAYLPTVDQPTQIKTANDLIAHAVDLDENVENENTKTYTCQGCGKQLTEDEVCITQLGMTLCSSCRVKGMGGTLPPSAHYKQNAYFTDTVKAIDNNSITFTQNGKYYFSYAFEELEDIKKGDIIEINFDYEFNAFKKIYQINSVVSQNSTPTLPVTSTTTKLPDGSTTTTTTKSNVVINDPNNQRRGVAGAFDHADDKYLYFVNNEGYEYDPEIASFVKSLVKGNIINVTLSDDNIVINIEIISSGTTTTLYNYTTTTTTTASYWEEYHINITSKPTKTTYAIGEELDFTGGLAYGYYENSDGMHADVFSQPFTSSFYTIDDSGFDNTKPGTYKIYIKYGTAYDSYPVTVYDTNITTTTTTTVETTTVITTHSEDYPVVIKGTFDHIDGKKLYLNNSGNSKYTLERDDDVNKFSNLKKGDEITIKGVFTYITGNYFRKVNEVIIEPTTTPTTTTPITTTTYTISTTSRAPEIWYYGTGVDHFEKVVTYPTKTVYSQDEELDFDGLVIKAFHSANRYSSWGQHIEFRTDYVWNVYNIDSEYITIRSLDGETSIKGNDLSKLEGGKAYIVKIRENGYTFKCNTDSGTKTVYDGGFSFKIYVNETNSSDKFIQLDNAKVESFSYGLDAKGFKIKGMDAMSIDMDAITTVPYSFEEDIRKGDIISGAIYVDTTRNYVYFGDVKINKYGGKGGDANGDSSMDMADVVLIMQSLANPNKYGLNGSDPHHITKRGSALSDMDNNGITPNDALKIQRILLGLDPMPVSENNDDEQPDITTATTIPTTTTTTTTTTETTTTVITTTDGPITHPTYVFKEVVSYPTKTVYKQGEKFDLDGLKFIGTAKKGNDELTYTGKSGIPACYETTPTQITFTDENGNVYSLGEKKIKSFDAFKTIPSGKYTVHITGDAGSYYSYNLCHDLDITYNITITP